jgi:hypothetical protein
MYLFWCQVWKSMKRETSIKKSSKWKFSVHVNFSVYCNLASSRGIWFWSLPWSRRKVPRTNPDLSSSSLRRGTHCALHLLNWALKDPLSSRYSESNSVNECSGRDDARKQSAAKPASSPWDQSVCCPSLQVSMKNSSCLSTVCIEDHLPSPRLNSQTDF